MTPSRLLLLIAFGGCAEPLEGDHLALGDSYFEWNREAEASIPDVVGDELGQTVANAAVSGAVLQGAEDAIPTQYEPGDWGWVLIDGGGNDLNDQCACGDCDDLLDELIDDEASTGVIPDLVGDLVDRGHRVAYVGYLPIRDDAEHGFDRCADELDAMRARLNTLADGSDDVLFIDGVTVAGSAEASLFDTDRVHPSEEGSRLLGEAVAAAIRAAE